MENQENKFDKKTTKNSDKSPTIAIKGVKMKIEDVNTTDLIKTINQVTIIIVVGLPCLIALTIGGIFSLLKDTSIDIMSFGYLAFALVGVPALVRNIKCLKHMKSELSSRELSKEDLAYKKKNLKNQIILAIVIGIAGCLLLTSAIRSMVNDLFSNDFADNQCKVCEETFTDSGNKRSISRTSMCEDCYENYKTMKDALGEDL